MSFDNLSEAVKVKFPTVAQLVALFEAELADFAKLKSTRQGDALEVRLQCTASRWKLHTGDPSYDTDHKGHWGASQISPDDDETALREIAADMIEQVRDSVAQTEESVRQIAADPTLLLTAVEEGLIDGSEADALDESKSDFVKQVREKGSTALRPIDPDEYPPIKNMEGPFRFRTGRILYYDPREGQYYDSKRDMYLPREERVEHVSESTSNPVADCVALAEGAPVSLKTIRESCVSYDLSEPQVLATVARMVFEGALTHIRGEGYVLNEAYVKKGSRVRLSQKRHGAEADGVEGTVVKVLGMRHNPVLGDVDHFMVKWDDVSQPQQVALDDIELV